MPRRQTPSLPESAPLEPAYYTPELLVERAQSRRGISITTRQIEEWHKAGLLPEPKRVKLPNQGRGRPPYSYPASALDAVIWLGRHRRSIDGIEVTRFWMRVDGFGYVTIDVNALVQARLERLWENIQSRVPSLPSLEQLANRGLQDDLREIILDEIDANITSPLLAHLQDGAEYTLKQVTIGAAVLGILPGATLVDNRVAFEGLDGGPYLSYADTLLTGLELSDSERTAVHRMLPSYVEDFNFINLYRIARRQLLTDEILPALRAGIQSGLKGKHMDVPRECDYEPIAFLQMGLAAVQPLLGFIALIELVTRDMEAASDEHGEREQRDYTRVARSLRSRLDRTYAQPIFNQLARIGAALEDAAKTRDS